MCVWFMTWNYLDMFFVVRSNDSFNFPLGLIKYVITVIVRLFFSCCNYNRITKFKSLCCSMESMGV